MRNKPLGMPTEGRSEVRLLRWKKLFHILWPKSLGFYFLKKKSEHKSLSGSWLQMPCDQLSQSPAVMMDCNLEL